MSAVKRLVRTENDRVLAGVCGGLARYFDIDASLVRIGFVAASVFSIGSPIIIYAIAALVMPKDDGMDGDF